MILTASHGGGTKPLSPETITKLRESDEVEHWAECGWACATGYRDGRTHVFVHASTRDEIERVLGRGSHARAYGHRPMAED